MPRLFSALTLLLVLHIPLGQAAEIPNSYQALSQKVHHALQQANYPAALHLLQQAHQRYPFRADIMNDLGLVYAALNQHDNALHYLQRAQRIAPDTATIAENLQRLEQWLEKKHTKPSPKTAPSNGLSTYQPW